MSAKVGQNPAAADATAIQPGLLAHAQPPVMTFIFALEEGQGVVFEHAIRRMFIASEQLDS